MASMFYSSIFHSTNQALQEFNTHSIIEIADLIFFFASRTARHNDSRLYDPSEAVEKK